MSDRSPRSGNNDLAGIEEGGNPGQELEDLKDEIELLKKNNSLLLSNQNSGKHELM